jgi:hypothetical protein
MLLLEREGKYHPVNQGAPITLPNEDHMAFCEGYDYETEWFQARERLRKKRLRSIHCILGPNNMSGFDRIQMAMDAVSWILYWGSAHKEFDKSLKRLAEFVKYLCGWTTQAEENWLDQQERPKDSSFLTCGKTLSRELRHSRQRWLFSERGSMNIADRLMRWATAVPRNMVFQVQSLQHFCYATPSRDFS